MNILQLLLFLTISQCVLITSTNGLRLQTLFSILSGELYLEIRRNDEAVPTQTKQLAKGYTQNFFVDYITYADQQYCPTYEKSLNVSINPRYPQGDWQPAKSAKRSELTPRIECIRGVGNGSLLVTQTIRDIVHLLEPHGNHTNRDEKGNCAIVLFYSPSCPLSAQMGLRFNPIASAYPDFRVGIIDANLYHVLNTEFGIVGLPTILIFHQGRPFMRFTYDSSMADPDAFLYKFEAFMVLHTWTEMNHDRLPIEKPFFTGDYIHEPDWCLWLSWSFISVCSCYFFTKTSWYVSIVEMAKRNWRESEAQLEHIQ